MYKVGDREKESSYLIAKLAFHAKESPIRTWVRVFGLRIFMAHQSGPWLTGQTPEDPLV